MSDKFFQQVRKHFLAARGLSSSERVTYLEQNCDGVDELRAEVESLLASADRPPAAIDQLNPGAVDGRLFAAALDVVKPDDFPATLGQYRILRMIGEGGMGTVYLAEQENTQRQVALKLIRAGNASRELLRRFEFEASVLGQLQHPGIAQIHEAGVANIETRDGRISERPFFAMEYVDGESLTKYVEASNADTRERLELVAKICDAVGHAHQKGVIHRDLKPANILVTRDGQPKILDFGVARVTDSDIQATTMITSVGQIVGTLAYMSPEQVSGQASLLDTRSDVYALGVVLYELLAGKLPHEVHGATIAEVSRRLQEEDPSRLTSIDTRFRGDLDTIVAKALEKDRDRRYESTAALAEDLRRHLRDEPITARPPSTLYQVGKFAKRHRGLVAGLIATFVALVAGIVATTIQSSRARDNEIRALASEVVAKRTVYKSSISAALFASSIGDYAAAGRYLDSAPEEFRGGWEYRNLRARIDPSIASWIGDDKGTPLFCVAYRGDLAIVALSEGRKVTFINLETGETLESIELTHDFTTMKMNDDATRLVTFSESGDRHVRVWDVSPVRQLLAVHVVEKRSRSWISPDGTRFATTDQRGLSVWDVSTGNLLYTRANGKDLSSVWSTGAATFSRDGSRLAWVPLMKHRVGWVREIEVLDSTSGELEKEFVVPYRPIGGMAFSEGGSLAVYISYGRVIIFDGATFQQTRSFGLEVAGAVRGLESAIVFLDKQDRRLAVSGEDGIVRICDIDSARQLFAADSSGRVHSLRASADGSTIALSVSGGSSRLGRAQLWDSTPEPSKVLRHTSWVTSATFSPDGTMVAGGADPDIRLWDACSAEYIAGIRSGFRAESLAFSPGGARLRALDITGELYLLRSWDTATGELSEQTFAYHLTSPPHFDLVRGGAKTSIMNYMGDRCVSSPDGSLLARSKWKGNKYGSNTEVQVADSKTKSVIQVLAGHKGHTAGVAFSHDNLWVVSGGYKDGLVKVWDLASGRELAAMPGHTGEIFSVDVSPDGKRIASAGRDRIVRLWDTESFDLVAEMSGHTSIVCTVSFSPDGTQLISGSVDKTIRLWDTLPRSERHSQSMAARALEAAMVPKIATLSKELGTPSAVAERLRGDATLDEASRKAGLRILLRAASEFGTAFWR